MDETKLRRLLAELGRRATGPGTVYLTGGATALWMGWRETTVDVDLKLDPEPPGIFEAIAKLKNELDVNIELASPDLFIPAVPGWRERSLFAVEHRGVRFYHYDLRGQALAKLARAHERDLADVEAMLASGRVEVADLRDALDAIRGDLPRYPALDADTFIARVERFLRDHTP